MKKYYITSLLITICLITFFNCKKEVDSIAAKSQLISVFRASKDSYPNISAHRGGKGLKNYPENALETIQYVSDSIAAIFEIDVAQTKDGKLVLMHDNGIDRTTDGNGLVKHLSYLELQQYHLVDDFGNATDFQIPLFSDVLKWCKTNNIVLTVDIKRGTSQKLVIDAIKAQQAEDISIIITYDVEQAISAYALAPELLLSVSARNHTEFDRLLETDIPTENMLVFTGTRLSNPSLYKRLHEEDIVCILGTLGNLDKQAEVRGDDMYQRWHKFGADIIATDRPFEAFNAIN